MRNTLRVITTLTVISMAFSNFIFYEDTNESQEYDMYIFSIQWGNTLCENNSSCKEKIKTIPKNIFTLHGLWPSLSDGRRLPECNTGELIPVKINDKSLYDYMLTYWISYTSANQFFWNHEYNKHGYCYTQKNSTNLENFFHTAVGLFKKYSFDQLVVKAFGPVKSDKEFTSAQIVSEFKNIYGELYFDIVCKRINNKTYLFEVRFYFDLKLDAKNYSAPSKECGNIIYIGYQE